MRVLSWPEKGRKDFDCFCGDPEIAELLNYTDAVSFVCKCGRHYHWDRTTWEYKLLESLTLEAP